MNKLSDKWKRALVVLFLIAATVVFELLIMVFLVDGVIKDRKEIYSAINDERVFQDRKRPSVPST